MAFTDEIVLSIPSDPAWIAVSRLFAAAVARSLGVSEENLEDVGIAVSEACGPSFEHSHMGNTTLHVHRVGDAVWFVIERPGRGFGRADVVNTAADDDPSARGGLGFAPLIILSLFDEATVEQDTQGGSTITFAVPTAGDTPPGSRRSGTVSDPRPPRARPSSSSTDP